MSSSSESLKRPLRPCLSPTRLSRASSPVPSDSLFPCTARSSSASSSSSSSSTYTLGYGGQWMKRAKSVRWEGEDDGSAVTSYHSTWSATEYDRTPLAPPSEEERACVLPERGSRCLLKATDGPMFAEEEVEEPEPIRADYHCPLTSTITSFFARSPTRQPTDRFKVEAVPSDDGESSEEEVTETCDDEQTEDEWDTCERRRMMFARMTMARDNDSAQPQFEGYRSLSATLVELLRQVNRSDDDDEDDDEGMRMRDGATNEIDDSDDDVCHVEDVNATLMEGSVDDLPTPRGRSRRAINDKHERDEYREMDEDEDTDVDDDVDECRRLAIHQMSDTLFISERAMNLQQDLFARLRGMSGDSDTSASASDSTEIGTPSLVSCSSSEADGGSGSSRSSESSTATSPSRPGSHLRSEVFLAELSDPLDAMAASQLLPAHTLGMVLDKGHEREASVEVLDPDSTHRDLHLPSSLF